MKDLYLVRRDVLDRIHQNPNAVPVVYPDEFGAILRQADVAAIARETVERLGLPALDAETLSRLSGLDKDRLVADEVKAHRDLIGSLDRRGYDEAGSGSRAAWEVLWDGMSQWDNRHWNWPEIAAGVALAVLCCPLVEEREAIILGRGSTAH